MIKSEEEAAQEAQQMQQQAEQQQVVAAQLDAETYENRARVDEKKAVAADIRKGIIQERLAKIKEGGDVPTNELPDLLQQTSILLMELMEQQNVQLQQEQQQLQAEAEQQQELGQGEAGVPPDIGGRPEMEPAI